jgi:hypothetical protein
MSIAIGLRAMRGGAVAVAVEGTRVPRLVLSAFLATAAEGDRIALEPYHVAFETPARAAAIVAEGRARQDAMALEGLDDIIRRLSVKPAAAALLVNRAGWVTDLLQYSLAAPEHPAVAEGLAVRDALRHALGKRGVAIVEMDEKSLPDLAPADANARLKAMGAAAGKPWRKEQKSACLAAWMALER